MDLTTYTTMKKTYIYNFFPVKEHEERLAASSSSTVIGPRLLRMLVEIRDLHPPPEVDHRNPWRIKKTLNRNEIFAGKIMVSFQDTFEHILRYWNLETAKKIAVLGQKVAVALWDMTFEKNPRKYEGTNVYFQMTPSGNCLLACEEIMYNKALFTNDEIGLYWETKDSAFRFKLFT